MRKVLHAGAEERLLLRARLATGELISAEKVVPVTWARGIDMATGRPIENPEARYDKTGKGMVVTPWFNGTHAWHPMSFNPNTGLVYVPVEHRNYGFVATERDDNRLGMRLAISMLQGPALHEQLGIPVVTRRSCSPETRRGSAKSGACRTAPCSAAARCRRRRISCFKATATTTCSARSRPKRGAGSSRTPVPFTIADHAADAKALLTALGVARAHVVGHSVGAMVALQLALDAPELVQSLVIMEPPIFNPAAPLPPRSRN